MTEKKYPEKIYPKPSDYNGQSIMCITPKDLELAYDRGYEKGRLAGGAEHLDPGASWTRLTSSHPDWDRIDWEALCGRPTILTHSTSCSSISTLIISKGPYTVDYDDGPREIPADLALKIKTLPAMVHSAFHGATQAALDGEEGWALYIHGDLPLRARTANQPAPPGVNTAPGLSRTQKKGTPMTEKKNYPEEIYPKLGFRTDGFGRLTYRTTFNSDFERAYDLGYQDGQQVQGDLTGWSNLTAAIKAGERIDWEQLDGLEAKCVHPDMGTLTRNLARRKGFSEETANGWCQFGENTVWEVALPSGWYGLHGWSLWVKGDLPLRKLTADQLKPGTYFRGKTFIEGGSVELSGVVVQGSDHLKTVIFAGKFEDRLASEVEVLEEYGVGTSKKTPKENA